MFLKHISQGPYVINLSLKGPYGRRPIKYKQKSSMLFISPLAIQSFKQPLSNSLKNPFKYISQGPYVIKFMEDDLWNIT